MRITIADALEALSKRGSTFFKLFEHGTLEVEVYKPVKVDMQNPHTRDEIYVIIEGSGGFTAGHSEHAFGRGDVLFVPAGLPHRFHDFSEDFCTWVFFFGPEGGEVAKAPVESP